ncbi:MAG TPA: ABC transporter permease subunit [Candidatus Aminicenantes bacterium]|nr:ABC transporter permease subunit [Candidatus Aminicenantes bacterium]
MSELLTIRGRLSRLLRMLLGALPVLLLLGLWFLLTRGAAQDRILSPLILPSPREVWQSLHSLWFEAELSRSIVASTGRVVLGFCCAVLLAFPLGVSMGAFPLFRGLGEPLATFASYLPIPALVPLTMSLFGIEETQKVMFLALAFFIFLLPMIVKAVDDVDTIFLQTAYTLGARRRTTVCRVLLPIALPRIFHAMRLGFGIGWSYIILAEMVAADRGLGSIIIIAQRRGPRGHIYLVLLVIVLIAYLTDRLWAWAIRRLFPYLEAR